MELNQDIYNAFVLLIVYIVNQGKSETSLDDVD